ncbi:MAG: RtcB family protein [Parachlamydiaceae bacterium]
MSIFKELVQAAFLIPKEGKMPDAYKNVDEVVEAVQKAKLANRVARLKPFLGVKG